MMNRFISLIITTLALNVYSVEGVFCENKLYILDYLMLENSEQFKPQYQSDEVHPTKQRFIYALTMNALVQKFANEITPLFNLSLEAFLGNKGNIEWQINELGFRETQISGATYNIPKRCWNENGKVTVSPIAIRTIQGNYIAYEYDPKLISLLEKDGLQMSYLFIGSIFRNYTSDRKDLAIVNNFFHGKNSFYESAREVRSFLERIDVLQDSKDSEFCRIGTPLKQSLVKKLKLPCEEIIKDDLHNIKEITIKSPGRDSYYNISQNDFKHLSNLDQLTLLDFGENISRVGQREFRQLKNLKSLTINNTSIKSLSQGMIYGLKNLVHINLSSNDMYSFKAGSFENMIIPLSKAPKKVSINLSHNPSLTTPRKTGFIVPGTFRGARAVTHLNISDMNLSHIKSELFDDFIRLKELDISMNYIKRLKGGLKSKGLQTVTNLNMANISLRTLTEGDFKELKSLKVLNLGMTRLRAFPHFLKNIKSLKEVTFCSSQISTNELSNEILNFKKHRADIKFNICTE